MSVIADPRLFGTHRIRMNTFDVAMVLTPLTGPLAGAHAAAGHSQALLLAGGLTALTQ